MALALTVERTTADHVAQAVGPDGAAILDLPAGESREFARALGARNVRVVDLGPDLRVPQIPCGIDERVVALPSPQTMAAWTAAAALLDKGLLYGDRLSICLLGGAGAVALESASADVAAELGWMLEQRGAPPQRRVGVRARGGEGMLALVQGELGSEEAQSQTTLREVLSCGPEWVRVCAEGSQPDAARVLGTGFAEVSVAVDWFAERMLASCALDPVWFKAPAALRALRQMG